MPAPTRHSHPDFQAQQASPEAICPVAAGGRLYRPPVPGRGRLPISMSALLYRQLADHYLALIAAGTLRPGERFPSVRQLMRAHDISMSTAVQACHTLEDAGHLEARPRSGYFVQAAPRTRLKPPPETGPRLAAVPADAYRGLNLLISEFLGRSESITSRINFGVAVAPPELYPGKALQGIAASLLRQQPRIFTAMARHYGHPELTEALARRELPRGLAFGPADVTVTHGCAEALLLALRATTEPGDIVAVESPTFHGVLQLLSSLGLRALEIPTSAVTGLSVPALELALRNTHDRIRAVLVMPTVHNPLGCSMADADKAALVALCAAHEVPLIEDNCYGAMDADHVHARPAKAWDKDGQVIYCASLNKILAPGMRIGWMLAGRWQARVEMLKYTQSRFPEELGQRVLGRFIDSRGFDQHLRRMQGALRTQRQLMADAVATHFGDNAALHLPEGGLLMWLKLPEGVSGLRLANAALEEGIRTIPGSLCSALPRFDGYLRLSCGAVSSAEIDEGVGALARLAGSAARGGGPVVSAA